MQTSPGQVQVINEIGSFVTLDVPGPRSTRLRAKLRLPGFTLGQEAATNPFLQDIAAQR